MSNQITKESLKDLGKLLRQNNYIGRMIVIGKEHDIYPTKLSFCNEILDILDQGKVIEVKSLEIKDVPGVINPDMNKYWNETNVISIFIRAYNKQPIIGIKTEK